MDDLTPQQLLRLLGNPQAYALQQEDGGYKPVRKPITPELLKQHLKGDVTVGTYVNVADKARFVVFDIDTGDEVGLAETTAITEAIRKYEVPDWCVGVEASGKKGYHVWVLLQDWRSAEELRRFGRAILTLSGVKCEVFPKQDEVRDLGNLVKLPGATHRVTGRKAEFVTPLPRPMPVKTWERIVVPQLPEEVASSRRAGASDERFPCMSAIQSEGVCEGGRNIQLFHLATMLRRAGLTDESVALVVANANDKSDPPLDDFELQQVLESSAHSGPVCDQLPEDRQCGELCIRARTSGLYTRPRQLKYAQEGENVVVTIGKRSGRTVQFEHDDLLSAKGVVKDGR